MASQTISRAQTVVMGSLRCGNVVARPTPMTIPGMQVSKIALLNAKKPVMVKSRKACTVAASANGNGLPIDLRGKSDP